MNLTELKKIREKAKKNMNLRETDYNFKIVVGMGTSAIALGAREVMKTFLEEVSNRNLDNILVTQTGEKGLSSMEPVVDVIDKDNKTVTYGKINVEKARKIIVDHIVNGNVISDYVVDTK